jgi:hypothetical protein
MGDITGALRWRWGIFRTILVATAALGALWGEDTWKGVEGGMAVGEVHGDLAQFTGVLRSAGVIDRDNNWSGGKTNLVQDGDLLDRGPDSRQLIELLMKLEKQARRTGGEVHCLIGNHETMNLYGDLRYVFAADYASYQGDDSATCATRPISSMWKITPQSIDSLDRTR